MEKQENHALKQIINLGWLYPAIKFHDRYEKNNQRIKKISFYGAGIRKRRNKDDLLILDSFHLY